MAQTASIFAPILICAASSAEARAVARGIKSSPHAAKFELLETGMGLLRARLALTERLGSGPKPSLIVSAGLAGALGEGLPLDSWITTERVYLFEESGIEVYPTTAVPGVRSVFVVSSSEVVVAEHDQQFPGIPEPAAVDMESASLAQVAAEHLIPFTVLRMISDTPDCPLPKFVTKFAAAMSARDISTQFRMGTQGTFSALRNPRDLVRLVKNSRRWSSLLMRGWTEYSEKISACKID